MKLHPLITTDRIFGAVERRMTALDNPGLCNACGAEADGGEPDARNHDCESCGELQVFAAEELMLSRPAH
jgi:hypothetical protein